MYSESFRNYIKQNATQKSIINARNVFPKFEKQNSNSFVYSYAGGASYEYSIEIDLDNGANIESVFCTCPYNYSGICKHIIASINHLASQLDKGKMVVQQNLFSTDALKSVTNKQQDKEQKGIIALNEGLFDLKAIKRTYKMPDTSGLFYYIGDFTELSFTKLRMKWSGWQSAMSEMVLSENKTKLHTSCSCSKTKPFCEHRLHLLELIENKFGNDFFKDGFWENQIEIFLEKYGLTLEDDYKSLFHFKLTKTGIKVEKLVKNLNRLDSVLPDYENEKVELTAKLNLITHNQMNPFGVGSCIDINQNSFSGFYPIKGKWNKDRSDFSAKINRIHHENFRDYIYEFKNEEDHDFIAEVDKAAYLMENRDIQSLLQAIKYFESILKKTEKYPIYKNDYRKSLTRKNMQKLEISDAPVRLFFLISETDILYVLKPKLEIAGKNYNINDKKIIVSSLFVILENTIYPVTSAKLSFDLQHFKKLGEANFIKKDAHSFYNKIIAPLSKNYEVPFKYLKKSKTNFSEDALEKQLYVSDLDDDYIVFKPFVKYDDVLVPLYSKELIQKSTSKTHVVEYIDRNQSYEDNFLEELKTLHPDFEAQDQILYLTPIQLMENYWLMAAVEKMKNMGIKVFGANDLKSFRFNVHKPTISVNLESGIDWFDIKLDVKFGKEKVDLKELQKSFIKQSNYVSLSDGTLGVLPKDWMKRFAIYFKSGEVKKNGIQLSNYQFGILDELYEELHQKPAFLEALYQKKQRLLNLKEIPDIEIPKGIKATLRHYQQEGLNWLAFLDENQLGGCLADDMGLGKTLQTITFLQYLKIKKPKENPSLIITPTSLIFNWKEEVKKFCPTLKILDFTGIKRNKSYEAFDAYDIILSTYGSLLNDVEFLKDYMFNYIILDESQAIKNPNSKRYKSVRLLQSKNRLVLTGTPIENNTFDLYAQLNFVNPGLLGTMTHFKKSFSEYIDKENDIEVSNTLSRIINPFVLRRTKEQVAKELPEKMESIIYCEMHANQRKLYDAYKIKIREHLLQQIEENGAANSQMYILEGLIKLRQICNSTALVNDEADYGNYSIKLDTLTQTIKDKTGKHKILVFSQFVGMLQLIKERLEIENVMYEYLDGQTRNRQDRVENFQTNENVRVFLISLKAGGTGLNLTEADYVFIVDPWWNPAVENQAIDRSYRIGQKNNVMAYRMICKDTIEEKIVALQSKKRMVANSIISIDEKQKSFNKEDIKRLFS